MFAQNVCVLIRLSELYSKKINGRVKPTVFFSDITFGSFIVLADSFIADAVLLALPVLLLRSDIAYAVVLALAVLIVKKSENIIVFRLLKFSYS